MKHAFVISICVAASVLCCACRPRNKMVEVSPPYVGDTLPMRDVVSEINANNAALPTLWARHRFEANIVDPRPQDVRQR